VALLVENYQYGFWKIITESGILSWGYESFLGAFPEASQSFFTRPLRTSQARVSMKKFPEKCWNLSGGHSRIEKCRIKTAFRFSNSANRGGAMRQPTDVFRGPAQPRSFLSHQAAVCGRSYRFDKGENNAFRRLRLKILMVSALNDVSDEESAPRSRQICPGRQKAVSA